MTDSYQKPTVESDDEPSLDIPTDASQEAHGNESAPWPHSPKMPFSPRYPDDRNIFVNDGIGRKLSFPFELARTWRVSAVLDFRSMTISVSPRLNVTLGL